MTWQGCAVGHAEPQSAAYGPGGKGRRAPTALKFTRVVLVRWARLGRPWAAISPGPVLPRRPAHGAVWPCPLAARPRLPSRSCPPAVTWGEQCVGGRTVGKWRRWPHWEAASCRSRAILPRGVRRHRLASNAVELNGGILGGHGVAHGCTPKSGAVSAGSRPAPT